MLKSPNKKIRETGAEQITVASLDPKLDAEDLVEVLNGDRDCRAACAGVFAFNLRDNSVRSVCREKLAGFFNDPEKSVRDEAASCFRDLDDGVLASEAELIGTYIQSLAFAEGAPWLTFALSEATVLLPDVVCGIPERLAELHEDARADTHQLRDYYRLPELVLRLYRQTSEPAIRGRCLDTIDRMLEHGIGQIDSELGKVER